MFYAWSKLTILRYRTYPNLFGVSLYQPKNVELHASGRKAFKLSDVVPSHIPDSPYLSQIPCSWGAVYFPRHWREFHNYIALRLSELSQSSALSSSSPFLPLKTIIVPDVRSNRWTKSWKKYFIEFVYLRGYTMLYPSFPDYLSLSTNHHELGVHVTTSVSSRKQEFEVPLMSTQALALPPLLSFPFMA
ncbi:hypothetical protein D9758_011092 [Tetrapyrgos nigripes]|uniref:Uncharacterized protein n=1 Tax=Tetrapyrgos nigripes TaxID=182062 RepID=A0A8H5FSI9_9AGAR|nr:hypothetical protein D9758_011092 [Tetrapyrgos nigripes]